MPWCYLVLSAQYRATSPGDSFLIDRPLRMLGRLAFLANASIDLNIYAQVGLVTLNRLARQERILIVEVAEQQSQSRHERPSQAAIASAESRSPS